jgi:hypothetical protein
MKLLHEKSACCGARIIRFGGKRRQCTACKKTWRVHPAKRGRKSVRKQTGYLEKVFLRGFRVSQIQHHSSLSPDAIYKRFAINLSSWTSAERTIEINGDRLILILDAEWQYFGRVLWTMYILAVKVVGSETAFILDPVMLPGKESAKGWRQTIRKMPESIKGRVTAVVSDGFRGIEGIAEENGWILQRCHFHLISRLAKMRGKRASTPGRLLREEIYNSVRLALVDDSRWRLSRLRNRLAYLSEQKDCPKRMRMVIREFLRHMTEFRSYLEYPELSLPKTTNVVESINSLNRRRSATVRTPKAWLKWTTACIRFKSKFTCK